MRIKVRGLETKVADLEDLHQIHSGEPEDIYKVITAIIKNTIEY